MLSSSFRVLITNRRFSWSALWHLRQAWRCLGLSSECVCCLLSLAKFSCRPSTVLSPKLSGEEQESSLGRKSRFYWKLMSPSCCPMTPEHPDTPTPLAIALQWPLTTQWEPRLMWLPTGVCTGLLCHLTISELNWLSQRVTSDKTVIWMQFVTSLWKLPLISFPQNTPHPPQSRIHSFPSCCNCNCQLS